jgi:hypothetical protein
MGLWLVGRRFVLSKVVFQQPRPERHLHVRVPALSMTRPRSLRGTLLANFFVSPDRASSSRPIDVVCHEPESTKRTLAQLFGGADHDLDQCVRSKIDAYRGPRG